MRVLSECEAQTVKEEEERQDDGDADDDKERRRRRHFKVQSEAIVGTSPVCI
jgi:hypothetical protein